MRDIRSSVYGSVTGREGDTRRNFQIYCLRPPPTGSVAPSISSDVLEEKRQGTTAGGAPCPINLSAIVAFALSGYTARLVTRIIE